MWQGFSVLSHFFFKYMISVKNAIENALTYNAINTDNLTMSNAFL